MKREDYSDLLDSIDSAIYTGELLYTNLDEVKDYIRRWVKAIKNHEETEKD